MGILTGLFILLIAWALYHLLPVLIKKDALTEKTKSYLVHIKSIGLFAMITGILGQLIGLYNAFVNIERAGDISPAIVVTGLKVSMISTLYGISIYLISILIWFVLDFILSRRSEL